MENIFDLPTDTDVTIDQTVDYLDQLVGEGKKFKSPAELAKGKAESDRYIELQKSEVARLKQELAARESVEALITKMKSVSQTPTEPNISSTPGADQNVLDDSSLEARLLSILEKRDATRLTETNVQKVTRILDEQFGADVPIVLTHKAKELGMTGKQLQQIAETSPEAFLKLIDANVPHTPMAGAAPRSDVNTTANQTSGLRNAAFYEKMKRENPKQYFDSKTTVQQLKDARELGDKYF